jgi:hypothetical protein
VYDAPFVGFSSTVPPADRIYGGRRRPPRDRRRRPQAAEYRVPVPGIAPRTRFVEALIALSSPHRHPLTEWHRRPFRTEQRGAVGVVRDRELWKWSSPAPFDHADAERRRGCASSASSTPSSVWTLVLRAPRSGPHDEIDRLLDQRSRVDVALEHDARIDVVGVGSLFSSALD